MPSRTLGTCVDPGGGPGLYSLVSLSKNTNLTQSRSWSWGPFCLVLCQPPPAAWLAVAKPTEAGLSCRAVGASGPEVDNKAFEAFLPSSPTPVSIL